MSKSNDNNLIVVGKDNLFFEVIFFLFGRKLGGKGGATTTPHKVPSAKICDKVSETLEPHGFEALFIWRHFGDIFGDIFYFCKIV